MEIWKDIKGYEGFYQISNLGRVRSLDRYVNCLIGIKALRKGKILTQNYNNKGYKRVSLCKNGKHKNFQVHRLVAEAFIPNPDHLPCINHKDEDKTNNHVDNLEWCSVEYNSNYGTAIERRSEKRKVPILQYDNQGNFIREWNSASDAYRELGIYQQDISRCCKGIRKSACGYIWIYKY